MVYIEWRDAASGDARWVNREGQIRDVAKYAAEPIVAAGFLLAEERDSVIIGLMLNPHNDDVAHTAAIPKGNVVRMVKVRPAKGYELVEK